MLFKILPPETKRLANVELPVINTDPNVVLTALKVFKILAPETDKLPSVELPVKYKLLIVVLFKILPPETSKLAKVELPVKYKLLIVVLLRILADDTYKEFAVILFNKLAFDTTKFAIVAALVIFIFVTDAELNAKFEALIEVATIFPIDALDADKAAIFAFAKLVEFKAIWVSVAITVYPKIKVSCVSS